MIVRITQRGTIDLPADLLVGIGVGPGDEVEVERNSDGLILRAVKEKSHSTASHADKIDLSLLGYLQDKIKPGTPPFDIQKFRSEPYDLSLRD